MTLSIIGAGFGRTGTLTLKHALESLDQGPCHHLFDVERDPDGIEKWLGAAAGQAVEWPAILKGYRSVADWPACYFWRVLHDAYPQAKVVLTVRDPAMWYESMSRTLLRSLATPTGDLEPAGWHHLGRELICERTFGGRAGDRDHAIAVYTQHNQAVRDAISPAQLLVYDVAEGWEPLCEFLGRPVPLEPFPMDNTYAEYRKRFAARGA